MADRINITMIACFLYFIRKEGVTIPTFVRKKVMIGNSKTSPVARHIEERVPMYDLILIWLTTSALISYEVRK